VSAAGMLRREVNQLQKGLTGVSNHLATFEQEQTKKPARTPGEGAGQDDRQAGSAKPPPGRNGNFARLP